MAILANNAKLIKVGQDYSAGSGISIDDHTISVTGEFGHTYSAGDNISIYNQGEQLYISSKDWNNDIANASSNAYNEAVSQIPSPFDPSYLSAQIDNKLDATAFTNWQNGQYSTDLQTIEGQIANKQDALNFRYGTSSGSISSINGSAIIDDYTYHMLKVTRVSTANLHRTLNSNSGTWNTVTNKLDATAFSTVSGDFLTTSFGIPESAVWQDVSTTVQTNSSVWGTSKPAKLIGWSNYQGTAIDQRAAGINGGIIATVYPDNIPNTMSISSSPYTYMNGMGFYKQVPGAISSTFDDNGFIYQHIQSKITASMGYGDVKYEKYNNNTSSTDTWSLTGSVQKSEIEYDADTSAITAIAGSAIGGGGGGVTGNYIPYTAVDSVFPAFETNSGLEIKTNTVAGTLYNTYINDSYISLSYINSNLDINDRSVLSNGSLSFKTNSDSAYVDIEKINTWDSASNYIQSNSSSLTDVSTTVQSNSAQWAGGVTGEFVPQSAFNELKQSYDALSASYVTLSSLFATYSGQWLLPNEGV